MKTKTKVIAYLVAALTIFAFGRWSAPEKIRIEKETLKVDVEKTDTTTRIKVDENKRITEVEIVKPDGTVIKKKTVDIGNSSETNNQNSTEKNKTELTKETKVVERNGRITLSMIAGLEISNLKGPVAFGGHITKPIFGPITLGAFGLSNGMVGLSLGLQF